MPKTVRRYVITDVYGWSTEIPGRIDGRRDHHVARKGDTIDVTEEEAARGEALDALSADAGDLEASIASAAEPPSWDANQLDSANVEDTVAYLAQHPSEAAGVLALEQKRDERGLKVRKGVVGAAERIQAAYDEQLEADALARQQAEDDEQRAFAASSGAASSAPRIP